MKLELPSAREMTWLAVAGWGSVVAIILAAMRFGGVVRVLAIVWALAAVLWTFLTGLRWASEAGRKRDE